jgi:DNA-binding MarR family transcriptional regulator
MKRSYGKVPCDIMYDTNLSFEARALYALLVCLQGTSEYCYPKTVWISEKTGYGRTKVFRLLKELSDKNYIHRSRDHLGRTLTQVANIY